MSEPIDLWRPRNWDEFVEQVRTFVEPSGVTLEDVRPMDGIMIDDRGTAHVVSRHIRLAVAFTLNESRQES